MQADFWVGRRVFLTGHTGFKGSWLSLWLQSLGAELTGYALKPSTNPSLFEEAQVAQGMTSIEGDIRDLENFVQAMRAAQPEIVIHMAAQTLVRYSYQYPVETYATNVMGTVHMLEAVRATPTVRAVVNITTDKCYDNKEWVWGYRESDPMGGYDPYSSSKGCAELVSAAYRYSFFSPEDYGKHRVALATVRAGNVIGGGDWALDRLIPDTINAFEHNQAARIRNPNAIRPWQHVLEPLRGYLVLAEKLFCEGVSYAEAWNYGPDDEDCRPVGWIVDLLAKEWGDGARWEKDLQPQPHEANFLKLDSSKAKARLGWHPRWDLSRALRSIVAWHKVRQSGADMRAFTLSQIHEYTTTAINLWNENDIDQRNPSMRSLWQY
jgi:CDP-glucose 4,6-dehydratase